MSDNPVKIALDNFGERVTRLSKINLATMKKDSTGKLRKSIKYNLIVSKNSFSFDIQMEDYGEWVDIGRLAGTYAPPLKILKWIYEKPIRLRNKDGEFVKQTPQKMGSLAYVINRKIFKEGIKPTYFLTEPFEKEFKKLPAQLIDAYALRAKQLMEQSLSELNRKYKDN